MTTKNEKLSNLAYDILIDIDSSRIPLNQILLKAARLSLELNNSHNVNLFKERAKDCEGKLFIIQSYNSNITSAIDPNVSISSSNPNQFLLSPIGNFIERDKLKNEAQEAQAKVSHYRAETYNNVMDVYSKYSYSNTVETIFEKKRARVDPLLRKLMPDSEHRFNAIEHNINSDNPEHRKNSVASCRALIMDIADILNPAESQDDKPRYINRLKNFVSPLLGESSTKSVYLQNYLEELKKRIEHTSDLTQGASHKDRPSLEDAQNVVLYTYLIIGDLLELYIYRNQDVEGKEDPKRNSLTS